MQADLRLHAGDTLANRKVKLQKSCSFSGRDLRGQPHPRLSRARHLTPLPIPWVFFLLRRFQAQIHHSSPWNFHVLPTGVDYHRWFRHRMIGNQFGSNRPFRPLSSGPRQTGWQLARYSPGLPPEMGPDPSVWMVCEDDITACRGRFGKHLLLLFL